MLNGVRRGLSLILLLAMLGPLQAKATEEAGSAFVEALENIAAISRPGQVGYAAIWDGNKYVQCYRVDAGTTRREAAGSLMQPSLKRVMRPDDLLALGWTRDDSFGNFVKTFPAEAGPADIAAASVAALTKAYDAEPEWFEVQTQWLPETECPPRNGPTQNLAGMINAMPASVVACSYAEAMMLPAALAASPDLYEPAIAAEIQRLRVNSSEPVFAVFDAGIGYVQARLIRHHRQSIARRNRPKVGRPWRQSLRPSASVFCIAQDIAIPDVRPITGRTMPWIANRIWLLPGKS